MVNLLKYLDTLLKLWKFLKFVILVAIPFISGWLAHQSPLLNEPTIIFSLVIAMTVVTLWGMIGISKILNELSRNVPTSIILKKQTNGENLDNYELKNVARYRYQLSKIIALSESEQVVNAYWDLIIVFEKEISPTTVRLYGIDGLAPDWSLIGCESRYAWLRFTKLSDNKFRITFNEETPSH